MPLYLTRNSFKKDKVIKLIDYITKEPIEDEQKIGYKYPFVANELLNCSENTFLDYFFNTNEEMQKIINAKTDSKSKEQADIVASQDSIQFNSSTNLSNKNDNNDDESNKDVTASGDLPPSLLEEEEGNDKAKDNAINIESSSNEEKEKEKENNTEIQPMETQDNVKEEEEKQNSNSNPNQIELLDHLLSFVETDKELNYVLVGYFVKFMCMLLLKKPMKIINYIYNKRSEILKHLVHHSYRKGICDLLCKLLLFENSYSEREKESTEKLLGSAAQEEIEYETLYPLRASFIISLFNNIDLINDDREKIANLFNLLSQLIENKVILVEIIESKQILSQLFALLQTDTNQSDAFSVIKNNYSELLAFFISIFKAIILHGVKLPSYEINDELVEQGNNSQEVAHTPLSKALFSIGFDALYNNYSFKSNQGQSIEINSTFNVKYTPLGVHRVKIIEFIANLFPYLKNIPRVFDIALTKGEFFPNTFDYLIKYEWNNIFQLAFSSLFKNYLNDADHHKELSKYLFEEYKILDFIQRHLSSDNMFTYLSGRNIFRGYNAILISLSYKINTIGGGSRVMIHNKSREGSISFVNTNITDIMKITNTISISNNSSNSNPRKSHAGNVVVCEFMRTYLKDSWNTFFKENVANVIKKFEKKLCEMPANDSDVAKSQEEVFNDESKKNEMDSNNPFVSKDDNFFTDDNDANDNHRDFFDLGNEVDMNDFEFTDEVKGKEVKEEDFFKEFGKTNMKVDELDDTHYNTFLYWKDIKSANYSQELNSALNELNLSK